MVVEMEPNDFAKKANVLESSLESEVVIVGFSDSQRDKDFFLLSPASDVF